MGDALATAVENLLTQLEYLGHVRTQAVEAVHAAAQVPLSDDAVAAVLAIADAIISSAPPDRGLSDRNLTYFTILEYILGGFVEVRITDQSPGGRPLDGFEFRMPSEQTERARAWMESQGGSEV